MRSKLIVEGKEIGCLVCGHDSFTKQEVLMNTRGATFMNMEWLNAGADTRTCDRCGYVHWFRRAR